MEEIKLLIKVSHNPSLIDTKLSPNENTIYHIYSDGEITWQKGSWAYGGRTEFSMLPELFKSVPVDFFPCTRVNDLKVKYGYAIVTHENALKIRELIKNL